MGRSALLFFILIAPVAGAQSTETFRSWNRPVAPYRVISNLYSVGASDITSFLVVTPEGHFIINSGFEETVPQIQENVRALGFRLEDVKVLLQSHAHFDHAAGHARLRELTGARVLVMEGDEGVVAAGGLVCAGCGAGPADLMQPTAQHATSSGSASASPAAMSR